MSQTKVAVGMLNATGTPGSGNFLRGDGTWNAAGGLKMISNTDISSAATYNFTGFTAASYEHYQFHLQNLIPATDNVHFLCRTSTDGGSSYDAGGSDYDWVQASLGSWTTTMYKDVDTSDSAIDLTGTFFFLSCLLDAIFFSPIVPFFYIFLRLALCLSN